MKIKKSVSEYIKRHYVLILFLIFLSIGIGLRSYNFPNIPPGINQDEISEGYNAYALSIDGISYWGEKLPVYFIAWGSGQNVLESYLDIPFVKLLGLNALSIRIVPYLIGIFTLVLIFFTAKELFGNNVALVSLFLLSIDPWHIMISRWSLESNLLPFFVLLSLYFLIKAIKSQKMVYICLTAVAFAISMYAYAIVWFMLPIYLIILAIIFKDKLNEKRKGWFIGLGIYILGSLPIFLFIIQNFIIKRSIFSWFPISIPLLAANRLSQVDTTFILRILYNAKFVLVGLNDSIPKHIILYEMPGNMVNGFMPIFPLAFLFAGYAVYVLVKKNFRSYKMIPILWIVAILPLFVLVNVMIYRVNTIYLPITILASFGIIEFTNKLVHKRKFIVLICTIFLIYSAIFYSQYISRFPNDIKYGFNENFDSALIHAQTAASQNEKIFITQTLTNNYIYVLFYDKVKPSDFRMNEKHVINNGVIDVLHYRSFVFAPIRSSQKYIYIIRTMEKSPCKVHKDIFIDGEWNVGECN